MGNTIIKDPDAVIQIVKRYAQISNEYTEHTGADVRELTELKERLEQARKEIIREKTAAEEMQRRGEMESQQPSVSPKFKTTPGHSVQELEHKLSTVNVYLKETEYMLAVQRRIAHESSEISEKAGSIKDRVVDIMEKIKNAK